MESQTQKILDYLRPPGRTISPLKALYKFNCLRLAARISDLRNLGYNIQTKIVKRNKKHFASYYLK